MLLTLSFVNPSKLICTPNTIYPLYEKKSRESATTLYQMLKIQDLPLDNREKNLDLLCFPDLYPSGINEQRDETRPIKLHDHEFIKCRLKSKCPQYRLNPQYIFIFCYIIRIFVNYDVVFTIK